MKGLINAYNMSYTQRSVDLGVAFSDLTKRTAKNFMVIKAAKIIVKEIEKAGLDDLKILADKGISIVGTYLQGCSPQEKAGYRRDLNALLQMGVTSDMLLEAIARQMPEVAPIIESKPEYKKTEVEAVNRFLKEG